MRRALSTLPALVLLIGPALAQEATSQRPELRPTRDVDVTYRTAPLPSSAGERVLEQRLRWSAASQLMRIDPPTSGLYVIIDYSARRMSTVRAADRSVIDMAAPEGVVGMASGSSRAAYMRQGDEQVAGLACADWQTTDSEGRQAKVCVTADGVLLRAAANGKVLLTAVSVRYAQQDPSVFATPSDYTHHAVGAAP